LYFIGGEGAQDKQALGKRVNKLISHQDLERGSIEKKSDFE